MKAAEGVPVLWGIGPCSTVWPGRPRLYCSIRYRRSWHYERERERELAEQREEWERNRYELDRRYYGKRKADQFRIRGIALEHGTDNRRNEALRITEISLTPSPAT